MGMGENTISMAALLVAMIYIPAASAWLSSVPVQAGMGMPHSLWSGGGGSNGGGSSSSSSWTARGGFPSGIHDDIATERSSSFKRRRGMASRSFMPQMVFSLPGEPAALVARVAEVGLKLKLVNQEQVKVTVDGSTSDLSAGRIQGVEVTGKGWASPRGLTCRTISANVGKTGIDVDALFKGARIDLLEPAKGVCTVVFNSEDFANFLAHPLFSKAAEAHWSQTSGGGFVFKSRGEGEGSGWHRNAAHIEAGRGCVLFAGSYGGSSTRLALFPLQEGVTIKPVGQVSAEVCQEVTNFFNNLVIDLDGAQLRLGSLTSAASPMRFDEEGKPGCVELEMRIDVIKFPNPITTSF